MVESKENTTAWTTATKTPRTRNGTGTKKGIRVRKMAGTLWSATMLPRRRSDSDTGRARWLTISRGSMSGASHQMGPRKCLKYFGPCAATPKTWVKRKTSRDKARLVLSVAVGGGKPG